MKYIRNFLLFIYILIAIFATVCLLSINDYRVTEFGDNTFIYIDKYSNSDKFKKGDLAIANKDTKYNVGDEVFFYNAYDKIIRPTKAKIVAEEKISEKETTYTLDNEKDISSEFMIGKVSEAKQIKYAGGILSILQSQWGFLFLIVLPVLIAFIYEIYSIILEVKASKQ